MPAKTDVGQTETMGGGVALRHPCSRVVLASLLRRSTVALLSEHCRSTVAHDRRNPLAAARQVPAKTVGDTNRVTM
ncbi:MAG: hypothetical protein J6X98_06765 [Bacteroidales bacterium]|nr:hypothetical protein [Bacteroidales bacterium]